MTLRLPFDMMLRTRDSNISSTLTPVLALVSWYSISMSSAKRCEEKGEGVWRDVEGRRRRESGERGRGEGRRKWRQNEDKVREFEKEEKRSKKGNEEREEERGRSTTC